MFECVCALELHLFTGWLAGWLSGCWRYFAYVAIVIARLRNKRGLGVEEEGGGVRLLCCSLCVSLIAVITIVTG